MIHRNFIFTDEMRAAILAIPPRVSNGMHPCAHLFADTLPLLGFDIVAMYKAAGGCVIRPEKTTDALEAMTVDCPEDENFGGDLLINSKRWIYICIDEYLVGYIDPATGGKIAHVYDIPPETYRRKYFPCP